MIIQDGGSPTWTHGMDWIVMALIEGEITLNDAAWELGLPTVTIIARQDALARASERYSPWNYLP
jgi:hypothetical protein